MVLAFEFEPADRHGFVFPFTHIGGLGLLMAVLISGRVARDRRGVRARDDHPVARRSRRDHRRRRHRVPPRVPRRATRRAAGERIFPQRARVRRWWCREAAAAPLRGEGGARRRRHRQRLRPHRVPDPLDGDHPRPRREAREHRGPRHPRRRDQGRQARRLARRRRARKASCGSRGRSSARATSTRRSTRRPSTKTGSSAPATSATSTTTATCRSPAG